MSWFEQDLNRFMTFERADAPAIDHDLKSPTSELNAGTFPCYPERC
jgi:hypothetical protein